MVSRFAALLAVAMLLAGACSKSLDEKVADASVEDLAAIVGCTGGVELVAHDVAPLRGGAATRGVRCTVGESTLDIFERATLGDPSAVGAAMGGALENIDRLVGTGVTYELCPAWVLVGKTWFIVADEEQALTEAERDLGGSVRPVLPASPSASYDIPGCAPS